MTVYDKIIDNLQKEPRELQTVPTVNRVGKWFYASVQNSQIVIEGAKKHNPPSKITVPRKLNANECEPMFQLYLRRNAGQKVSDEAASTTYNQVYWYSLFHNCL